jgi:hypothetical protein
MKVRRSIGGHLPRLRIIRKPAALAPLAIAALAWGSSACGGASAPHVESRFPLAVEGQPTIDVRVALSSERQRQRVRWVEGARHAIRDHIRMLGWAPAPTMTVVDRPGTDAVRPQRDVIAVAAPLVSSHRGMTIEASIARATATTFWHAAVPCDADRAWFVDGLARYTAIESVSMQYDGARVPPAAGALEQRYFSGLVPWVLPAEVPAWRPPPRAATDRDAQAARVAAGMQTLANWIGAPTADAVVRSFVTASNQQCASWPEMQQAAADVTGLDLSWLFQQAFGSDRMFDYGIERLTSAPADGAGRYKTRVVVRRYGSGQFTGTSRKPIGSFDAGRGVEISVHFADGHERLDLWDGRAEERIFEYDSDSPAESAVVDPRHVIVLDVDRTNNGRRLAPKTNRAANKWSAAWGVWLQHLLLTYGSLV